MKTKKHSVMLVAAASFLVGIFFFSATSVLAHCDTTEGPVILDAKQALKKGDVTPVLKWVKKDHEDEIRAVFKKTLTVRGKGPEARELADTYFFETLVRLHRAGEGAPYTGLKQTPVEPVVAMSDKALKTGSIDFLLKKISAEIREGIAQRFTEALEKRKHVDESVEAGREYVEAYVQYVHYVEGIHAAITSKGEHHGESSESGSTHQHKE
jgi:Family of unknown function (DUF6448)